MLVDEPRTIIDALRATAARHGDERGIRFYTSTEDSDVIGYAELDRRARAVAAGLQSAGIGPGDTALLALLPGLAWPVAVFGALYAGVAIVPAALTGFGTRGALAERTAGLAVAGECTFVLTEDAALDKIGDPLPEALPRVILLDKVSTGDPEAWVPPNVDGDTTTFLMFTSGSTGDPKGVIGTHRTAVETARVCAELFGMDADAVMVGWAPLHHAMGLLLQVLTPAVAGADAVITGPEQFQRRPVFWLQLISRHRGTASVAGNFAFALCTQFATDEQIAELDLSSLRALICGSEPVRPETVAAFLERFAPTGISETAFAPAFGMTEASLVTAKPLGVPLTARRFDTDGIERGALVDPSEGESTEIVSCGRWPTQSKVRVVDPDSLEVVPDGTIGELWFASPTISPGYFRRPDATAETFGHRLAGDESDYLRSGDLGAVIDGEMYVTGRLKEVIIVRGRNIYPQDLEAAAAAAHDVVGIGAAFELDGHPSPIGIVAEYDVEAAEASRVDLADVAEAVRTRLVSQASLPAIAVALVPAGAIPRTPTGKVRRQPARRQLEAGSLPLHYHRGFRTTLASTPA